MSAEYLARSSFFCWSYDNCSHIYMFLKFCIGTVGLEPLGALDFARFRLLDMFTHCTHAPVKNAILKSFCVLRGNLRLVVANVALGIHWRPSNDTELYIQLSKI